MKFRDNLKKLRNQKVFNYLILRKKFHIVCYTFSNMFNLDSEGVWLQYRFLNETRNLIKILRINSFLRNIFTK